MEHKVLKICHMSSVHRQEDTRIFHKECVSLAKEGYNVFLLTRGNTYIKNGVHIIGINSDGENRLKRMLLTTKNIYKKAIEIDADIYHAHDPELLPILLKLKRNGKKTIFDSHEHTVGAIREKKYIPKLLRKIISSIYENYQTYACKKMDAVITATPNITDYFKSIGCQRVVDICNFPLLRDEFTEPYYGTRAISFAGGTTAQWNHDCIINAINEIDNITYLLCGGNNSYLDKLKNLSGWKKVDFKGFIPFEQVEVLLRHSTIGMALLTPGENTDGTKGNMANTKIFEEMMAGLPVICTNFERWRKFVEGYDCGICVDPHNVTEIREAIKKLIDNPELARRKGLNGRHAVEKEFNWSKEETKLLALYNEIKEDLK